MKIDRKDVENRLMRAEACGDDELAELCRNYLMVWDALIARVERMDDMKGWRVNAADCDMIPIGSRVRLVRVEEG